MSSYLGDLPRVSPQDLSRAMQECPSPFPQGLSAAITIYHPEISGENKFMSEAS